MVSKRKRSSRRRATTRRRSNNIRRSGKQSMAVHRRLVLFPKVSDSDWLQKLAWFSSVALKLFSLVVGVSDDLKADSANIGSGSTILLGPGDFAALSPVSVPITTSKTDKEVKCLKAFPFERASLSHVHLKIVPSVDMSDRGGMYAACIIPIDPVDATIIESYNATQLVNKFSCSYDDIIKNPRAKMAPVTRSLSLSIALSARSSNIRIRWDGTCGFVNAYPSCALMVAFSDLAAKIGGVNANYAPNKALFEVHLTGQMQFHEPAEITVVHESSEDSMSCYTPKILMTGSKSINVRYFDQQFETTDGRVDLTKIDRKVAIDMLQHFNRMDLVTKLDAVSPPSSDFEKLDV